jgi:hypothetical protein
VVLFRGRIGRFVALSQRMQQYVSAQEKKKHDMPHSDGRLCVYVCMCVCVYVFVHVTVCMQNDAGTLHTYSIGL